ncbi:hypothetical protein GCM10007874_59250 [Labrys miyagiensis]|uniref:Uncharacterized protein n=1 Tax=Labrys miyagiensis TaxID=346912 RepID=A0ABQ6CT15_9HYPH|nr:hypothetical protein GCM10007874_59250 [Labrys miyagiensis]
MAREADNNPKVLFDRKARSSLPARKNERPGARKRAGPRVELDKTQFTLGKLRFTPERMPVGQREVTVFRRV